MTDKKSILERLRENNPFASYSSPLPWDNTNPDLAQLSRMVSEEIEQLIRHKRREPSTPLAGLILGAAGSGKTHMLMRILNKLRENENPSMFIVVERLYESENITQDLLSEIFISLRHIHKNRKSQFDVIVEEVLNVYKERRNNDGYYDLSKIDKRVYLARDMPRLDRDFLKGLLLYADTDNEAVKSEILEWLERGLDDEDSQRLGLPSRDMASMSDAKRESVAQKTLISLGLVLGYAKIPMIVCFDQLEIIRDRALIEALGDLVSLLMNNLQSVLPLCFVKPDTWQNQFVPVLDASIIQRIENNTMLMDSCTKEQTLQLIHDRIANTFKEDAEEIYQWLISKMRNSLKPGTSPRIIIGYANRIIMSDETDDPVIETYKTVSAAYDEEYKNVQSEPRSWPPNADNLKLALSVWLEAHEEFEAVKGEGKYIRIIGETFNRRFAFVICARRHNAVALAAFRRGCEFLKEYPEGKCFYVTEDTVNKSTWKKVKEQRDMFEGLGGHVIMLDKESRINWYALTALINRTDNGDVNLYLSSGSRTASRDDLKNFVRSIKLIPEIFNDRTKNINTSPESRPVIEPDVLNVNLKSIVNTSPMHMITVEKAVEMLSHRKIITTRNELVTFLKNNTGVFKTFNSNNDILITLLQRD